MPRGSRLDAPGMLHHVVVRGLDQCAIFPSDGDRQDFVGRLTRLLPETETTCLAWSLVPNQVHLALRSGPRGLAHIMRRLLTGYAASFNRRHGRAGHVFQNRYHSTLGEENTQLSAWVRSVHRYPLQTGVVSSLAALADYPWCGHGALLGRVRHPWQATEDVLARFSPSTEHARRAYEAFVAEGQDRDELPWRQTDNPERLKRDASPPADCRAVVAAVCLALGLSPEALASGRRSRPLSNGRAVVAYVARTRYRISCAALAAALGTSSPAITLAERRGALLVKRRIDLKVCLSEFLN
jgi:hypothetical protein